jgi:multiple antibiotic resistance protein
MAGPGAITATILLAGRNDRDSTRLLILLAVITAVLAICFVVFCLATRISKWLGVTANVVASRLLGVLLAALAVQYVIDGVRTALAG